MVNVLTKQTPHKEVATASDRKARRIASADLTGLAAPCSAIEELATIFKLVADETRLRVLYFLTQRSELHVRALCELLGQSQPAVSHHLALLRMAGLIDRRREGKHNFYALRTGRLTELLDKFFARLPENSRRLRLEDYVLSHAPI
jgi:ArsR family transcriptional regulator